MQYAAFAWKSMCALLAGIATVSTVVIGIRQFSAWTAPEIALSPEVPTFEFKEQSTQRYPFFVVNRSDETRHDVWIAASLKGLDPEDVLLTCPTHDLELPNGIVRRVSVNRLSLLAEDGTPILAYRIPRIPRHSQVEIVIAASKVGTARVLLLDPEYRMPREERVFGETIVERPRINLPEDGLWLSKVEYAYVERVNAQLARLLHVAENNIQSFQFTAAEKQYLTILETLTTSIDRGENVLFSRLMRVLIQSLLARSYYHLDDLDEAERWLDAADLSCESLSQHDRLQLTADLAARPGAQLFQVNTLLNRWESTGQVLRAQIAGKRNDWPGVQKHAASAETLLGTDEFSENLKAYINAYVGMLAASNARVDESLERLNRTPRITSVPRLAMMQCAAWHRLSVALRQQERREEAVDCLTRAIEVGALVMNATQEQFLIIGRAELLCELSRWEEAEVDFRRVLFKPEASALIQGYAWRYWHVLGDCYIRMDRAEEGRAAYEMSILCCRQMPRHLVTEGAYGILAKSLNNVAWLLVQQENVDKQDLDRAIALIEESERYLNFLSRPARAEIHDTTSLVYLRAGEHEKAKMARQRAQSEAAGGLLSE